MTTEAPTSPQIQHYLDVLEARLTELPNDERIDLLGDLQSHLEEIRADEPETPLADRIGPPHAYAEEFAASIGLGATPATSRSPAEALADAFRRIGRHPATERGRRLWIEMRPAWWTIRGLIIGLFLAWNYLGPGDPRARWLAQILAGVLVLGLVGVSMRIGRNQSRSRAWKWLSSTVTIAGLFAGLLLMANISARTSAAYDQYDPYDSHGSYRSEAELRYLIDDRTVPPMSTTIPFDPRFIVTP